MFVKQNLASPFGEAIVCPLKGTPLEGVMCDEHVTLRRP